MRDEDSANLAPRAPDPLHHPTEEPVLTNPDPAVSAASPAALENDAHRLFVNGRFAEATDRYASVHRQQPGRLDVQARLGYLDLLANRASAAVARLSEVLEKGLRTREVLSHLAEAYSRRGDLGLAALCYQQLGREGLAGTLAAMSTLPVLQRRGTQDHCELGWLRAEPLPVIAAEINGTPANLVIDTGAGDTVLDAGFAIDAGIRLGGREWREFAGGHPAEVLHGHADRLHLGGIRIGDVPVQVLDLHATFGDWFPDLPIHGILGVRVMSQFHCSLDYAKRSLILHSGPANGPAAADSRPMWLAENWMLFSHADFPGNTQATVFVDSGMTGAAFALPASRVDALGVVTDDSASFVGAGGGGKLSGIAAHADRLRFGATDRRGVRGLVLEQLSIENSLGFQVNALIGHDMLRDACLTLDFSNMQLTLHN